MSFRWMAVLLLMAAATRADKLTEAERLQFADGLYSREMSDLAVKEYVAFLEAFPASADADMVLFRLGESYRKLKDLPAAERNFRRVYMDFPDSKYRLKAGFRRADLFRETSQYQESVELFRKLLTEKLPKDMQAASQYFLGEACRRLGDIGGAVGALETVAKEHPDSEFYSYALLQLGQIHGEVGGAAVASTNKAPSFHNPQKSLEYYQRAATDPKIPRVGAEALFQMGDLYFRQKLFDKSAEAYGKLIQDYPSDSRSGEARLQAAWAAHNAGLYAEALSLAEAGLAAARSQAGGKDPKAQGAEWLYLKANCERQLVKNAEAHRSYGELLALDPDGVFGKAARYEQALTSYRMGQFDKAVTEASKIKLTDDVKKDVYWLLAESFSAMKAADQAIQYYRLLIRDFPKSDVACDATYRLAYHLQARGDYQEAARYYGDLARDFPKNPQAPQALFASAYCLLKMNLYAEAARDWTALVRDYPGDSLVEESLYQKGICETQLKRYEDALTTFAELLRRFPKSRFAADGFYWQGMLLRNLDKFGEAEAKFREALKHSPRQDLVPEVQLNLGLSLQKTGKFEEALQLLRPLLTEAMLPKFTPVLLQWMSEFSGEKKDFQEAVRIARLLVDHHPDPAWQQTGWALIGRGQMGLAAMEAAEQAFRESLATKARTRFAPESALRLGEIAFRTNRLEAAEDYFRQAAALASDETLLGVRAQAYAGLGRTAMITGDAEGAARYFMSVAILYDDAELVPECLFNAAEAFGKIGRDEEKQKAVEELKTRYPQSEWAKRLAAGSE